MSFHMEEATVEPRRELSTQEASQRSGLSRNHITYLLRQGKLEGRNFGHRLWLVYADSLDRYLGTPHKPGPKGTHKKASSDHLDGLHSSAETRREDGSGNG